MQPSSSSATSTAARAHPMPASSWRDAITRLCARMLPSTPDMKALADIDDIALTCDTAAVEPLMRAELGLAGYDDTLIDALATDIGALAGRLSAATGRDSVSIRLEVIETDACRRFHADYVTIRLLCTYVGPGTLWLDDRDAAAFRAGADPSALAPRQLGTGEAVMMTGRLLSPDGAALHCSPPIAGTGVRRLVLAIDPAGDIAPATY